MFDSQRVSLTKAPFMQKLILADPNVAVCRAWQQAFESYPTVEILNSRFEEVPHFDCMVSAANSFGLMDGGVDLAIARFFGVQLMARVQTRILHEYLGDRRVGTTY